MSKFKTFLKQKLGISDLETELEKANSKIKTLEKENQSTINRLREVSHLAGEVSKDNCIIRDHVKFLNSNFSVVSDISPSGYDPTVIIVMYKGKEEIVKTFQFNNETVEQVYRILEGFGKDRNRIDKPSSFPSPRFRF